MSVASGDSSISPVIHIPIGGGEECFGVLNSAPPASSRRAALTPGGGNRRERNIDTIVKGGGVGRFLYAWSNYSLIRETLNLTMFAIKSTYTKRTNSSIKHSTLTTHM